MDQANVWLGTQPKVDLVLDEPLSMLLSYNERRDIQLSVQWQDPIPAPIKIGDAIGTLTIKSKDKTQKLVLRARQGVPALGIIDRFGAAIKYLIFGAPTTSAVEK